MKMKLTSIAIASLCAAAVVAWSVPASAEVVERQDKGPGSVRNFHAGAPSVLTSVPEPGTMALLALGLAGLGLAPLRRHRKKD